LTFLQTFIIKNLYKNDTSVYVVEMSPANNFPQQVSQGIPSSILYSHI